MIIQNLINKFSEETQYLESRQDGVSPDVNGRKANTVIIPAKFKDDIKALEDYAGRKLESGVCIKVDLAELLTVIPKERRRADAYNALVQFMRNELGVDLIISSSSVSGETPFCCRAAEALPPPSSSSPSSRCSLPI